MSPTEDLLVNYYYPCGEILYDRVGSVTIDFGALNMYLIELIKQSIGNSINLEIFKILCLWEDIKAGSPQEPNSLSLHDLLKILIGDTELLSKMQLIDAAFSLPFVTGTRRYQYC